MEFDHLSQSYCIFALKLFNIVFAYHVFHFLCLHHGSKNPLICDLDFSILSLMFLHNRRHPSHPPVIPGVCRCEFGTLCKPFFGSGEVHSYRSSSYVSGCLGLHNILPYVWKCKQQRWHANNNESEIASWSTPELTPFESFIFISTSEQKETNKQKHLPSPKLTWHMKMDGWKTNVLRGWLPCRCYIWLVSGTVWLSICSGLVFT